MAIIIAFPSPESRAHGEIDRALDQFGNSPADTASALETILRQALQGKVGSAQERAARWLRETQNVQIR